MIVPGGDTIGVGTPAAAEVTDGEGEGLALGEGEALGLAEGEALGLAEGEALGLGEGEALALGLGEGDALGVAEGDALGMGVTGVGDSTRRVPRSLGSFGCTPQWNVKSPGRSIVIVPVCPGASTPVSKLPSSATIE